MRLILFVIVYLISSLPHASENFVMQGEDGGFTWINQERAHPLLFDPEDESGIIRAIQNLKSDAEKVTGIAPTLITSPTGSGAVIVGSVNNSRWIGELIRTGKLDVSQLKGKREKYIITTVQHPFPGMKRSCCDCRQRPARPTTASMNSPDRWVYHPGTVGRRAGAEAGTGMRQTGTFTDGEPAVRYRGIFLNDEAPALSGWAHHTFGGFNHLFYEKVFELILRLRGNFLWPAMLGNAFFDDDPENGRLAQEMGIVIGTSHHEPMGRAHDEWRRHGSGPWNYQTNAPVLRDFWKSGMERMEAYETLVTVGLRGDGDEPMSEESNIALLEEIIGDQRGIIAEVTGKEAAETPQVWALYKEVQDYYDKGMRVPDDVTLLLCDDNWGNVRKLPMPDEPQRSGGYGMYYHFDYVGRSPQLQMD